MKIRRNSDMQDTPKENLSPEEAANPQGTESLPCEETAESVLKAARIEAEEWRDKYLRKLADFDNYRKRTRQESEMLRQMVSESLLASLLPIVDDFERMLAAPGDAEDPYRRGAVMILGKLQALFDSHGVQRLEAIGKPFDPAEHDALLTRPTPDFPTGIVTDVITPGYRMGDRIIRHAQVVVSVEPDSEANADS